MGKYDVMDEILSPEPAEEPELETLATAKPGKYDIEYDTRTGDRVKSPGEKLGFIGGISEAITGEKRKTPLTESLPEFRETEEIQGFFPRGVKNKLKIAAGL